MFAVLIIIYSGRPGVQNRFISEQKGHDLWTPIDPSDLVKCGGVPSAASTGYVFYLCGVLPETWFRDRMTP